MADIKFASLFGYSAVEGIEFNTCILRKCKNKDQFVVWSLDENERDKLVGVGLGALEEDLDKLSKADERWWGTLYVSDSGTVYRYSLTREGVDKSVTEKRYVGEIKVKYEVDEYMRDYVCHGLGEGEEVQEKLILWGEEVRSQEGEKQGVIEFVFDEDAHWKLFSEVEEVRERFYEKTGVRLWRKDKLVSQSVYDGDDVYRHWRITLFIQEPLERISAVLKKIMGLKIEMKKFSLEFVVIY